MYSYGSYQGGYGGCYPQPPVCCGPGYGGGYGGAIILVLFILLVIVIGAGRVIS